MSVSEMRRQRKAKAAAALAAQAVEQATERVVAARPTPSPPQDQPSQVRHMRDELKMSWMAIGAALKLPGSKSGAGRARALYAAANGGVVPRTHAPRKGTQPRAQTPGSAGTVTWRKQQLVDNGHVIPRDMPDEEVEALVCGRTIEWAIDLARLTDSEPESWGPESKRWVTQDAKVHVDPQWVYVSTDEASGERHLRFREYAGFDTDRQKHMSGPTRVVRVDAIFTIR